MNLMNQTVLSEIQRKIDAHHELYPNLKIDSTFWEHILYDSLNKAYDDVQWDPGSHVVGTDIVCNGIKISCKGGSVKGKKVPRLVISSHRTTSYETLEEKLEYLSQPHEDVIYSLSLNSEANKYTLTIFEPVDPRNYIWEEVNSGWKTVDSTNTGDRLKIQKKMSDQYWMELVYDTLNKVSYDFTISK